MSVFFAQKSLIVCPNERQALALWEVDAQKHQALGEKAWETLPVCSWSDFVKALWEEHWLAGRYSQRPPSLMNEWQERFLWMRVIQESQTGSDLLNAPAAAQLAAEAWKLSNAYELLPKLLDPQEYWPEDTRAFLDWVESFRMSCEEFNWLETCRLEPCLVQALNDGSLPSNSLPKTVSFRGFAEWTPAQQTLLDSLSSKGVEIQLDQGEPESRGDWRQVSILNASQEIEYAARWMRKKIETHPNRRLRVGLVVLDLSARRSQVDRILREVFQPSQMTQVTSPEDNLHDISVGAPLSSWPVAQDALKLLQNGLRTERLESWQTLLHSPFLGDAESERAPRALLWNKLVRDGRFELDLRRIQKLALGGNQEPSSYHCPKLAQRLGQLEKKLQAQNRKQKPSEWAVSFSEHLETLGWPGERSLNSSEYQTVARWNQAMSQLGSLDNLLGPIKRETAVSAIRRIADETVYQPKVSKGQIEVMGTLEAIGLNFDFVWLAGFHDAVWPGSSRPNPYLPFLLQKECGVAHSTPDRELEFSRRITQQLLKIAPQGVVSFPLHSDAQECRPSPMFSHLVSAEAESLDLSPEPAIANLHFASKQEEIVIDPGPKPVDLSAESRGGTSLFKDQAACPFRAFAYHRLQARPQQAIQEGLDAAQRGTMLHEALESLWKKLGEQSAWLGLDTEEQQALLRVCAEHAVEQMRGRRPDVLKGIMVSLERRRLESLLSEWMLLEASREPFRVLATEEKVALNFAGLNLKATIDRIDQTQDGSLLVIDYKTGNVTVRDWSGERPNEPQLPLYSVANPRPVDALCFARLRTGNMSFQGISKSDDLVPGVKISEQSDGAMSWPQRQKEWLENLENLAQEFRSGVCQVDPKDLAVSCRYCGLEGLCRIDEENLEP